MAVVLDGVAVNARRDLATLCGSSGSADSNQLIIGCSCDVQCQANLPTGVPTAPPPSTTIGRNVKKASATSAIRMEVILTDDHFIFLLVRMFTATYLCQLATYIQGTYRVHIQVKVVNKL